ncbi:MAG: FHA domain-containing protein [Kastovskya adunca ATA6-11-RM4]|jgi:hypothetical protein|nr:FHA domain-containing protein [Kastovskya adunca ATA6-11-RM4]
MHELTLEWQEKGQIKRETIYNQQRSRSPGTVRLGRDPARCDLVLSDPTISGLHVEIFFNTTTHNFALRNLRQSNPPVVNGEQVTHGEISLSQGSIIYLGQAEVKVVAVLLSAPIIPPTMLVPPTPSIQPQHSPEVTYGLECPRCHRTSAYERLDWGCQWCGTSLAAAASVLMTPISNSG